MHMLLHADDYFKLSQNVIEKELPAKVTAVNVYV